MISRRQQLKIYEALLEQYSPEMADVFLAAIIDAKSSINLNDLAEAIERNDIFGIVEILQINEKTLFPVTEVQREAFIAGGQSTADFFPTQAIFGFNGGNPSAVAWLAENSGTMITQLSEDVLPIVQETLSDARQKGQGARKTALDLIGRRNPNTKKREGGVLGLNAPQARAVRTMRKQLESLDKDYFKKKLRDKRFDKMVAKAIESGEPLTTTQINRIVSRYEDRQLRFRAENVARYETNASLTAGQFNGFQQMLRDGLIDGIDKEWKWNAGGQETPRLMHQAMSGTVIDFEEDFIFDDGVAMAHPHDERGGPKHNMNCFAPWTNIHHTDLKKCFRHDYSGEMIEFSFGPEDTFTVTPNHPILTNSGWMSAGDIGEGDSIIRCFFGNIPTISSNHNVEDVVSTAEQLYYSNKSVSGVGRVSSRVVNLHGYIPDQDVNVVNINRKLRNAFDTFNSNEINEIFLSLSDMRFTNLSVNRSFQKSISGLPMIRHLFTSSHRPFFSLGKCKFGTSSCIPFGPVWSIVSHIRKASFNSISTYSSFFRYTKNGISIFKKFFDYSVMSLSFLLSFDRVKFLFCSGPRPVWWRYSEVFKARQNSTSAKSGFSNKVGNAFRSFKSIFNHGEKRLSNSSLTLRVASEFSIRRFHYSGPVYNFESKTGILVTDNVVNHNCRCTVFYTPRINIGDEDA